MPLFNRSIGHPLSQIAAPLPFAPPFANLWGLKSTLSRYHSKLVTVGQMRSGARICPG